MPPKVFGQQDHSYFDGPNRQFWGDTMSYRVYIIAFDPEHGTYTETEIMEGFATEQEAVDHARNRLPEVQQELAKLGENLLCSYRIRVVDSAEILPFLRS